MNLMEGILHERDRVRDLIVEYEKIGPAGIFGAALLRAAVAQATAAIGSGDVVAMIKACQSLKECQ